MYLANIIALLILGGLCFFISLVSIEYCKKELVKITNNQTYLNTYKWLTYGAFLIQIMPWLGVLLGYIFNKDYSVSVLENLWPLTRLTLFCSLTALMLVGIAVIFEEAQKFFEKN